MNEKKILLSDLHRKDKFKIKELIGKNCLRLREIGFCEEGDGVIITEGNNISCRVCGACIGISKNLSKEIIVEKRLN